jgi:hypothetical protein
MWTCGCCCENISLNVHSVTNRWCLLYLIFTDITYLGQGIRLELYLTLCIQNPRFSYQFSDLFFIMIVMAICLSNCIYSSDRMRISKNYCIL